MSMLIVIFMSFRGPLRPQVTRYGLHARQVAYATPYTGGSDGFVSSTAAPIASGWSEPSSRAGLSPAVDQRLFTAHVKSRFIDSYAVAGKAGTVDKNFWMPSVQIDLAKVLFNSFKECNVLVFAVLVRP